MKSYTDLEQSRKLESFLPLESTDMHYVLIDTDSELYSAGLGEYIGILPHYPCWSLSALLDILPTGKVLLHDKGNHGYKCICNNIDTDFYDNPINVCYNMIIKLYELKML